MELFSLCVVGALFVFISYKIVEHAFCVLVLDLMFDMVILNGGNLNWVSICRNFD
jgi:hypothetical protein